VFIVLNMRSAAATARRDKQRTSFKAELREAARTVFVRDGYRKFSMRKLAAEVGSSAGAIYLYFGGKEELFHSIVEESFARLAGSLDAVAGDSSLKPDVRLKRGLRVYVDWGIAHPLDYEVAFLVADPVHRPYRTHRAFDILRTLVSACHSKKRMSPGRLLRDSESIWAAVHGITSLLIQRPNFRWHSTEAVVQQVIDSAVDGALGTAVPRRSSNTRKKA
jgi:AcrR family transcriptional regulator